MKNRFFIFLCFVLLTATTFAQTALEPETISTNNTAALDQLRSAYLTIIDAEWAAANSRWSNSAALYTKALDGLNTLRHDYPGWQSEQIDRCIADCHNRIQRVTTTASLTPHPATSADLSSAEERIRHLLAELTRVRMLLVQGAPSATAPSATVESDSVKIKLLKQQIDDQSKTNKMLRAENAHLAKQLKTITKKFPYLVNVKAAVTNATPEGPCAALIRSTAREQIQVGAVEPAILLLREGVDLFPEDIEMVRLLGTAYCRGDRYEEAALVVKDFPIPDAGLKIVLGSAYFSMGQLGLARLALEEAIKLKEDSSPAHYNMAQLLVRLNPPEGHAADTHYRRSLEYGGARDANLENNIRQAVLLKSLEKKTKK